MLLRTHLAFAVFLSLIFIPHLSHPFIFMTTVLIATIIPDLDSKFSSYGRHLIFRPLQFFVAHRGIIHSFTTATFFSLIIAVFYPIASLGFFLGYTVHVICDAFTKEGIQPFWPFHWKSAGPITAGGRMDELLFFIMIFVDIIVFIGFFLI